MKIHAHIQKKKKKTQTYIKSRMERYLAILVAENSSDKGKGMMGDFNVA